MPKLEVTNENYACRVVRFEKGFKLPNLDSLLGANFFGELTLVSEANEPGLYLWFPAECQIHPEFLSQNNLFSSAELNADSEKKGYFAKSGRVKSLKLRGNISTSFVIPVESLNSVVKGSDELKEGDIFNSINGYKLCKKYVLREQNTSRGGNVQKAAKVNLIDEKMFPQHTDTTHWLRICDTIDDEVTVIVTEKIHSTSGRFTNTRVRKPRGKFGTWLENLGVLAPIFEYQCIAGSKKVVKIGGLEKEGYYKSDVWNSMLERIKDSIPKNYIIYGEIAGWDGEKALQRNYTYQMPIGTTELYVYRVAIVNDDGLVLDLSWEQIKEFCKDRGLKTVPELEIVKKKDFHHEFYEDKKFVEDLNIPNCLPLDSGAPCSEGVVLRIEGIRPQLFKYKSPAFILHETKQNDDGIVDVETQESEEMLDV
mgnify:CR=1 FL=1